MPNGQWCNKRISLSGAGEEMCILIWVWVHCSRGSQCGPKSANLDYGFLVSIYCRWTVTEHSSRFGRAADDMGDLEYGLRIEEGLGTGEDLRAVGCTD